MKKSILPIIYALLAAGFYALNTPFSKLLLNGIPPTYLAGFLYLGSGLGVGLMCTFAWKKIKPEERLEKGDFPYVIGIILCDIFASIAMMFGLKYGNASNASLLGNFEVVATTIFSIIIFKDVVSSRLWFAIALITFSSVLLTFGGEDSFSFSLGSIFVILATSLWGLNNCFTKKISAKNSYEIVTIMGLGAGFSILLLAHLIGEEMPDVTNIFLSMLLGFVSYGLSVFVYIKAQRDLGAPKTGAYYASAPFIGVFLSVLINDETLSKLFYVALFFMFIGIIIVVIDTLEKKHSHLHTHRVTFVHEGVIETKTVSHEHVHSHFFNTEIHSHKHNDLLWDK